jgi:hypothetical protein
VSLTETQEFFARTIQKTVPVVDQVDAAGMTPRLIAGNDRLSPADQLEIYREQFWLRHVDSLKDDFGTVAHLLGETAFHKLCEDYLVSRPCAAFSLRDLGAELPSFVADVAPYSGDPLLVDCAQLEWAFIEAFDAADATPVAADAIVAVPEDAWSGARLRFHPALRLCLLRYPAHDFRAAQRRGENPARPAPGSVAIAVYRGPEVLHYIEVEPLAGDLLVRLMRGDPLGEACEAVALTVADGRGAELLEEKVGGWFQFWAGSGWLTAIETSPPERSHVARP